LEANVTQNINSGLYEYRTGYIYPGTYTVALVCEDDNPDVDEDLTFYDVDTVEAIAGPNGTQHDFVLADPPI
jgi:hypothetical protein